MPLKIIVADSSDYGRDYMERFLRENFDCEIVDKVSNGHDLECKLMSNNPDLVIADIDLPGINAIEVCHRLKQLQISIPVIGMSMTDENYQCRSMLDAGARGFLMRNAGSMELKRCIDIVCEGTMYVCVKCQHLLTGRVQKIIELGNFERQVLLKVVERKSTTKIAEELFSSRGTVKRARRRIVKLAETSSPYGILRWAIYYGYVSLNAAA